LVLDVECAEYRLCALSRADSGSRSSHRRFARGGPSMRRLRVRVVVPGSLQRPRRRPNERWRRS